VFAYVNTQCSKTVSHHILLETLDNSSEEVRQTGWFNDWHVYLFHREYYFFVGFGCFHD